MAGFLDSLRALGGAHLRHVEVLRMVLQMPDTQAARDHLAASGSTRRCTPRSSESQSTSTTCATGTLAS